MDVSSSEPAQIGRRAKASTLRELRAFHDSDETAVGGNIVPTAYVCSSAFHAWGTKGHLDID